MARERFHYDDGNELNVYHSSENSILFEFYNGLKEEWGEVYLPHDRLPELIKFLSSLLGEDSSPI